MIKVRTLAKEYQDLSDLLLIDGVFRVYKNVAPEGTPMPFLVWSMTSSSPIDGIDCAGKESFWDLQFDVYSGDQEECDDISDTVIDFINSFGRFKGYLSSPTVVGEYRNTLKAFAIDAT